MANEITLRVYSEAGTLLASTTRDRSASGNISTPSTTLSPGANNIYVSSEDTAAGYAESARVLAGSISVNGATPPSLRSGYPQSVARNGAQSITLTASKTIGDVLVAIATTDGTTGSINATTRFGETTWDQQVLATAGGNVNVYIWTSTATATASGQNITFDFGSTDWLTVSLHAFSGSAGIGATGSVSPNDGGVGTWLMQITMTPAAGSALVGAFVETQTNGVTLTPTNFSVDLTYNTFDSVIVGRATDSTLAFGAAESMKWVACAAVEVRGS